MHAWLTGMSAHPHLVLAVVFGVACAESLAVVGTFVPAAIVMFVAGALIGAGVIGPWPTFGVAALGAIAGDGISYELGRRYRDAVLAWSRRRAARVVTFERAERFIDRHGGKSIVLARFLGPVRAIVPLLAGAARMPRRRFYPINVVSAFAWAFVHIAPGIVFGASAQLAEAVSARLAAMLLLLAALLWAVARLARLGVRRGVPLVKSAARRALERLMQRHPHVAQRLRRLMRFESPRSMALVAFAMLFVGSAWLFVGTAQDVIARDPLTRANVAVYSFLQALRTTPADAAMVAVAGFAGRAVTGAVAAAVLLWLAMRRCWRGALVWAVGAGIAFAVAMAIGPPGGVRPFEWRAGAQQTLAPSADTALDVLVYASLAWLLVRRRQASWRSSAVIAGLAAWLTLGALARLYLGVNWLADVVGGASLGLAWFALLGAAFTSGRPMRDDGGRRALAVAALAALAIAGSWTLARGFDTDLLRYTPRPHVSALTLDQWTGGAWRALPAQRAEISGDREEDLPLQWAGQAGDVTRGVQCAGWRVARAWSLRAAAAWLLPRPPLDALPVLPKFSQGTSSELAFVRFDPAKPATRIVLRLWRSGYVLDDGASRAGASNLPIWYGAVYRETLARPAGLFTIATAHGVSDPAEVARLLALDPRSPERTAKVDGEPARRALLVTPGAGLCARPVD